METFLCEKCSKLFYNPEPTICLYCKHHYVIWVTYKGRSKKEVETILKKVST